MITIDPVTRRQVLGTLGAGIAIPTLASLWPRAAQAADDDCARYYVQLSIANGWIVATQGHANLELPDTQTPMVGEIREATRVLRPLHDQNLDYRYASRLVWRPGSKHHGPYNPSGQGPESGHDGEQHNLTGDSVFIDLREHAPGPDYPYAFSVDQRIADHFAEQGALPRRSVHLGPPGTIARRGPDAPLPNQRDPAVVFDTLFQDPEDPAMPGQMGPSPQMIARARRRQSVLDFVARRGQAWKRRISVEDGRKIDQHLDAVRTLEQRLQATLNPPDAPPAERCAPVRPDLRGGDETDAAYWLRAYTALVPMLFACRITRVVTLGFGHNGQYQPSFAHLGYGAHAWHHYSHAGGYSQVEHDKVEAINTINTFFVDGFARMLADLRGRQDADGQSLLHQTTAFLTGGIGSAPYHDHSHHVGIIAGGGGGAFRPGRWHVDGAYRDYGDVLTTLLRSTGQAGRCGVFADGPIQAFLRA
jgi:hypothetical protein